MVALGRAVDFRPHQICMVDAFQWAKTGGEPEYVFTWSNPNKELCDFWFRLSSNGRHVVGWECCDWGMHAYSLGCGGDADAVDEAPGARMLPWQIIPFGARQAGEVKLNSVDMMDTLVDYTQNHKTTKILTICLFSHLSLPTRLLPPLVTTPHHTPSNYSRARSVPSNTHL